MNSKSEHFKLFADCIPVKGKKRSIIYDLSRTTYKYIPNDLYYILTFYEGKTIEQVKQLYDKKNSPVIDEYFQFLTDYEYIFFCDKDELGHFPKLLKQWDYPGIISNSIIELPIKVSEIIPMLKILENLGCRYLQFRSFEELKVEYLNQILDSIKFSNFEYVELILKKGGNNSTEYMELFTNHQRLRSIYLHSSDENKIEKNPNNGRQIIISTIESKKSHVDFQTNNKYYFNVDKSLFFESQFYNSYYNKKICITKELQIKNCLSLDKEFGLANNEETLLKIVNSTEFKELWEVKKSKIIDCRKCEYRFMCVDNTPLIKKKNYWQLKNSCFYKP